jgi:hypothetical protein
MELTKKMIFVFVLMGFAVSSLFAATHSDLNQGIFTAVKGQVEVKTKKGHKAKTAEKDLTVFEGDRVITQDQSSATLRFFDGSTLDISPNTEFVLSKVQKPSDTTQDKILQFKLIVGQLLAAVQKLTTSKSSFEIEAGGVVCGVRGTRFSLECVSGQHAPQVVLKVFEGTVYAIDTKGNKFFFHPGSFIKFENDVQTDISKAANLPANSNNGDNNNGSTGLNDLNQQFKSNIIVNQNKTLNSVQGGSNVTIKPYVGN